MSGIAGIYHFDGRPVGQALLTRLTDAIAHRGPDGVGHWVDGPVGVGHRMLHTTAESLQEHQPLLDETGNLCLTLDGRVDNRDDLKTVLEGKGVRLRTDTDAEFVLQAYACWGEACPKRIIGDFAFVIWDRRKRQLFCARDILSMKPFYYYISGQTFLWASEPQQLFADPLTRREPNEGMIGEYLASAITHKEETLFRGVLRLPPAHVLIVKPGGLRKTRYWDIDPAKTIRYRTDAQYTEHFSELFTQAVRCRLRSHGPVGAELSGGIDSSSVACLTQSLSYDASVTNPGFETFSLVFQGLPCDESAYIQDVVRMGNMKSNLVYPEALVTPNYAQQHVHRYHDFPDYPNAATSYPLKRLAREKGFRVLLTGFGGDQWLFGNPYYYADLLRRLRLPSLIRRFRRDSGRHDIIGALRHLLTYGLCPLLPRTGRRVISWGRAQEGFPPWINSQFARRVSLRERIRTEIRGRDYSSFAQWAVYKMATHGWQIHFDEMDERAASWFGLERRHPLSDRRIVEWALAVPEEQRQRRGHTRFVLREAVRGLLPDTVQNRVTKADFSAHFATGLKT